MRTKSRTNIEKTMNHTMIADLEIVSTVYGRRATSEFSILPFQYSMTSFSVPHGDGGHEIASIRQNIQIARTDGCWIVVGTLEAME